ncbi:MAG: hypothetical protein HYV65_00025 [Candidatus Spechtbacteria bacterium]|nr:hypothetical protein [Candidatus Spechtbacteria bacterium]
MAMTTQPDTLLNGNGNSNATVDAVVIAENIKNFLFCFSAGITVLYLVIILLRFAGFQWFAQAPTMLNEIYLILLGVYLGTKEVYKAKCNGALKRKPGEVFFVAWWSLFLALLTFSSFHIGQSKVLDEVWPHPLLSVSVFFVGNEMVRFRSDIISLLRSAISTISASLPQKNSAS